MISMTATKTKYLPRTLSVLQLLTYKTCLKSSIFSKEISSILKRDGMADRQTDRQLVRQ